MKIYCCVARPVNASRKFERENWKKRKKSEAESGCREDRNPVTVVRVESKERTESLSRDEDGAKEKESFSPD